MVKETPHTCRRSGRFAFSSLHSSSLFFIMIVVTASAIDRASGQTYWAIAAVGTSTIVQIKRHDLLGGGAVRATRLHCYHGG